eukprot:36022-Chlamydomonas_euryale.AAC.1
MGAAWKGDTHCVRKLLQHDPAAQVAAVDRLGYTPLLHAALRPCQRLPPAPQDRAAAAHARTACIGHTQC